MDPWVASTQHNFNDSAFCRLSDELLLDIMRHLDDVSIFFSGSLVRTTSSTSTIKDLPLNLGFEKHKSCRPGEIGFS